LKVTTQQTEDCVTNLTIEVDDETMGTAKRKAAQEASRRFQIPGFRKGKAPYDVIARLIGEDYLAREALEDMAPELVAKAIEEQEIRPYGQPELTALEAEPPRITVAVPTEPVVELGDYHSIHLERESVAVSDEDVEKALNDLRAQRARLEPIERPLQVGDMVTGRLLVQVEEGPTEDNEKAQLLVPTPEEEDLPGVSEHLVGATVGDVVEFDTVFPVDHPNDQFAGKSAHVTLELNQTEVRILPELNDEFAVMMGDYDDLESLRRETRARLEVEAKNKAENKLRDQAIEALVEISQIKYPQLAVEEELDRIIAGLERRFRAQRVSLEALLQAIGLSPEDFRERQRATAEKHVRQDQALRQFIKAEGIQVTDEELTARLDRLLNDMGPERTNSEALFRDPEFRALLANRLAYERGMRRLVSIVTGEPEPPEEELSLEDMPAPSVEAVEVAEGEDETAALKEE